MRMLLGKFNETNLSVAQALFNLSYHGIAFFNYFFERNPEGYIDG